MKLCLEGGSTYDHFAKKIEHISILCFVGRYMYYCLSSGDRGLILGEIGTLSAIRVRDEDDITS